MIKLESRTAGHKAFILPDNSGVVDVLQRAVRARRVPYNYMVVWKDVNGIGVQLAVVNWLAEPQVYVNPLWRR